MALATAVNICKLAVIQLGADQIVSLTQDSKEARLCNALYEHMRDSVLTDNIWNFAQKRAALAQLAEDPVYTDDGVTIVYQIPSDSLKINFTSIRGILFKIEEDKILSDTSGLKIKYTARITDTGKYFPGFVTALAGRLAAEMAYNLTNSRSLAESLFSVYYTKKLPAAAASESQQGTPLPPLQDELTISRQAGRSGFLVGQTGWQTWYPITC